VESAINFGVKHHPSPSTSFSDLVVLHRNWFYFYIRNSAEWYSKQV